MVRQVVLDTETTGINPSLGHRIIEIGCIEIVDRLITDKVFHCYINPQRQIDPGAYNVHGISNEFLQDKPKFSEIITPFLDFIKDAELIIHNAPFDVGFIDAEFKRIHPSHQNTASLCQITDSLELARQKHPGQRNSLDALCKRYGVDNSNRELHGALLDAELLAKVYLMMTGGQGHLFLEQDLQIHSSHSEYQRQDFSDVQLISYLASDVELESHNSYMKNLKDLSNQVIWTEVDTTYD